MSGEQHINAKLSGYGVPVFTPWVDQLNKVVDSSDSISGSILQKVGGMIPGYLGCSRPDTSDDYGWFWALKFDLGMSKPNLFSVSKKKTVLVAFPWAQDWSRRDGLELDRSIAIYTRGGVSPQEVNGLLLKLINALKAV